MSKAKVSFSWKCPFCSHTQTVTEVNYSEEIAYLNETILSKYARIATRTSAVTCSNVECKEVEINVDLLTYKISDYGHYSLGKSFMDWKLHPESNAKVQPEYILPQIRQDYVEACRILNLSPKASATLSRRCIQGIIRDFCKISRNRLVDEIDALRKLAEQNNLPTGVTSDTIEAIDHVRSIGNIGAHFEKDINVIVDVDPGEAQALIDLIEILFEEWYVAAHKRSEKLRKIKGISEQKKLEKTKSSVDPAQAVN